jgi:transglutaminase-like putative cysteine protease
VHFEILHTTVYEYSAAVALGPHILRLSPRCDGEHRLLHYRCDVRPEPVLRTRALDAEGNQVTRLWFSGETRELRIACAFALETGRTNPYDYVVETPATRLPVPYGDREAPLLAHYRYPGAPAMQVAQFAARLAKTADHDTLAFLNTLNAALHGEFRREIREHGAPQPPEVTLERRCGACRDLAVLFMAVCRTEGIAARFVSGYQARPEIERARRYMHSWPEVYIPGGGWRGFDPSHGTAVGDAHVALAASREASGAAPVEGIYFGQGDTSRLHVELKIDAGS